VGIAAGDVVVGLGGVETGTDGLFELADRGAGVVGQAGSHPLASVRQRGERVEGVADHGCEIEGASGLIERPEGLGTVGIKLEESVERTLRELMWSQRHVVEGTQQGERV
jgi:hypothetical protein